MVPVLNKPFMEYTLSYLKQFGIKDIILTLNYLPDVIRDYFGDGSQFGVRLAYCMENEPLGTAGAVKNADQYLDGTFIVFNGDIFTDLDLNDMLDCHRDNRAMATISLNWVDNPSAFGVVETASNQRVMRFIEKQHCAKKCTHVSDSNFISTEKFLSFKSDIKNRCKSFTFKWVSPGFDSKQTTSYQLEHFNEEFDPPRPWIFVDEAPFDLVIGHNGWKQILPPPEAELIRNRRNPGPKLPYVQTLLKLALQIKDRLDSHPGPIQAVIARELGMSRVRVTQILNLLRLDPEIQRSILAMPPAVGRGQITEHQLRRLVAMPDPRFQVSEFNRLTDKPMTEMIPMLGSLAKSG